MYRDVFAIELIDQKLRAAADGLNRNSDNTIILMLNGAGVTVAHTLLAISLWLSTDVPLKEA